MTIDERSRRALFLRLEELRGADEASTLMEHLPPVGWADVATKRDLDALSDRFRADLATLEASVLRHSADQVRNLYLAILGSTTAATATVATLAFAAARLT